MLELPEPKPIAKKKNRFFEFLNSAFTLWFLSSVALAAISFEFKRRSENSEAQSRLIERINVIENELTMHFTQYRREYAFAKSVKDKLAVMARYDRSLGTYPEFKDRRIEGIVLELEQYERKLAANPLTTEEVRTQLLQRARRTREFFKILLKEVPNTRSLLELIVAQEKPIPQHSGFEAGMYQMWTITEDRGWLVVNRGVDVNGEPYEN